MQANGGSVSLASTSVSSNTILSATSAFFTLVFGAFFPGSPDDAFTHSKLVGLAAHEHSLHTVSAMHTNSHHSCAIPSLANVCTLKRALILYTHSHGDPPLPTLVSAMAPAALTAQICVLLSIGGVVLVRCDCNLLYAYLV